MTDAVVNYVRNMLSKGYKVPQIRTALLSRYHPKFVARCITEAQHPGYTQRREFKNMPIQKKIGISNKIGGILIHPGKIFREIKDEDMIHTFNLYAGILLILFLLVTLISLGVSYVVPASVKENNLFFESGKWFLFAPIMLLYLFMWFIGALLIPFSLVAYYYLFLKKFFRMGKGYDGCYKAIIYSAIQAMLLGLVVTIIFAPIYNFFLKSNQVISLITIFVLFLVLLVYNLVTQIKGLGILCEVEGYKAAVVTLTPIVLAIATAVISYFILRSWFISIMPAIPLVLT